MTSGYTATENNKLNRFMMQPNKVNNNVHAN